MKNKQDERIEKKKKLLKKQGKTNNMLPVVCDLIRKNGLEDRLMETLIRIKKSK